jgi:hypothetical protein
VRGARRRRGHERGFVLSDHADWPGLLQSVRDSSARQVYLTHGQQEVLARYLREVEGLAAEPLRGELASRPDLEAQLEADAPAEPPAEPEPTAETEPPAEPEPLAEAESPAELLADPVAGAGAALGEQQDLNRPPKARGRQRRRSS